MSAKLVKGAIQSAANEGFESVALGGGEPLHTLPLTQYAVKTASKAGLLVAVTTSGYRLTKNTLRKLEAEGINHLQLSLGDRRVNITSAYEFMVKTQRCCSFGVNLLLSPRLVPLLPAFIKRFDEDGVDQATLLLPKGNAGRFTYSEFMRYYSVLKGIKAKHTAILVDCATQQILQGRSELEGCSFFPDGTVSKCAFDCEPRVPWKGSLTEAMREENDQCKEGLAVLNSKLVEAVEYGKLLLVHGDREEFPSREL
jgi:hypothetical protein